MLLAVTNIFPESETTEGVPAMEAVDWLSLVAERRDRDAFEQLYGYFAPRIKRYMMRQGADRLRALVSTLPEEQMDVVRLAFFEGLSHSEVSHHLSVPIGTVKSRLRLAFSKLRAGMGEKI
jgi:RNA polymerase sigma factor (sigma-70 family)